MNKILVPYDFSQFSVRAIQYAVAVASKVDASIELVHVIELPVISDPLSLPVFNYDDALKDDLDQKTDKEFKKVVRQYGSEKVHIQTKQLFGPVSRTILEYAGTSNFDWIIIGSHGASEFSEFMLGSNAMKIVRTSSEPVIVVKDQVHTDIKSIVFPHSLETELQEELVEKVIALQRLFKAHLHLVHVNSPLSFTSEKEFMARLDKFLRHFKLTNYTARIYDNDDYAQGITRYAKSVGADLIMMATDGRTGISRLINISVAENVIHQSNIPVWTWSTKNVAVPVT